MSGTTLDHQVRIGDRERARTADVLTQAIGSGHLDLDEVDARLTAAWSAATRAELDALVADLPVRELRRASPAGRARRAARVRTGLRIHAGQFAAAAFVMIAIWLTVGVLAGAWYPWPIWPIGGGLIGLIAHTAGVRHHLAVPLAPSRP